MTTTSGNPASTSGGSESGGATPVSVARACEALFVAGVVDLAFRVWAIGRKLAGRPVPKGILGRP